LQRLCLLVAERHARIEARRSLLGFARFVMPAYETAPHLARIAERLEAVERGDCRRLMVFCPPRHGKSQLASRYFPAWFLGRNPAKQIISASYNADLAGDFGRFARNLVASDEYRLVFPNVKLAADSSAANRWHTNAGGAYVSAGVGTAITGRGADVAIIDDPVKDWAEAASPVVRSRVWEWYTSTLYTRLMPGASIVLIATRWHADDLAGRILDRQTEDGEAWDVVSMPALDAEGNALWPERYPAERLAQIRESIGSRHWTALYMQSPVPDGGAVFRREWFRVLDEAPKDAVARCRAWDCAATAGAGDWSVGALLSRSLDGIWTLESVVRGRWSPAELERVILQCAAVDGKKTAIRMEQEGGSSGKTVIGEWTRRLAGYDFRGVSPTGSKELRWIPFARQAEAGNVRVVRGPWNAAFLDELAIAPAGEHDDQADAVALAFNEMTSGPRGGAVQVMGY
jgi:predicted phage terminase large subunit-like protein